MLVLLAAAALLLAVASWIRFRRLEQALVGELAGLTARLRDLAERVDAAEADVGHAVTQTEIAESLLLDKGIAEPEELEALRRRVDEDDAPAPAYQPERDGALH